MKSLFLSISLLVCTVLSAQTTGTLTLTFTQTPHTSYQGTKNVMAVWIESSTGTFVKTRARNAGGGTSDHLPVWAVKSGGSAGNCLTTSCNTVGTITGATLNNFSARNFSWDGRIFQVILWLTERIKSQLKAHGIMVQLQQLPVHILL